MSPFLLTLQNNPMRGSVLSAWIQRSSLSCLPVAPSAVSGNSVVLGISVMHLCARSTYTSLHAGRGTCSGVTALGDSSFIYMECKQPPVVIGPHVRQHSCGEGRPWIPPR